MDPLQKLVEQMDPKEALAAIADAVQMLSKHVSEKDRLDFVVSLIGDAGADKIASMVNL